MATLLSPRRATRVSPPPPGCVFYWPTTSSPVTSTNWPSSSTYLLRLCLDENITVTSCFEFFSYFSPPCQVRVGRFYVSCPARLVLLLGHLNCKLVIAAQLQARSQWPPLDPNRENARRNCQRECRIECQNRCQIVE